MKELDLTQLDPGIRRTVAWLRERGFQTTDSGDGVSKFDCASPHYWPDADTTGISRTPHVIIQTQPNMLVMIAEQLYGLLRAQGVLANVDAEQEAFYDAVMNDREVAEPPSVQASYNPGEEINGRPFGVVMLVGVDDARMFGSTP